MVFVAEGIGSLMHFEMGDDHMHYFFFPIFYRQICGQASMFDMATTAQKTKGRSKGMKKGKSSKASKASKSVKKAEPFPDKAGDSFLPFQGACASTDRTSPCQLFS